MPSGRIRVLCVIGTRPEAIKMAPVVLALRQQPWACVRVLATAQHREMLDQILPLFGITSHIDLDVMEPNQTLPALTARLLAALDESMAREQPDLVLAQGDTTSVLAASLVCFYRRVPFAHIEAGLRTHDLANPFPEEMNRVLAGRIASLHFAPTERARRNLLEEGVRQSDIHVTGNTVIDAQLDVAARPHQIGVDVDPTKKLLLVTAHRRESFGAPFIELCQALRTIVDRHDDVQVLYPVHPNPNVSEVVYRLLSGHPRILLCGPLEYAPFVAAMKCSFLILTDSGGVQEEAPALGKPVLVLRDETERPEAVDAGVVRIVGMHAERIVGETDVLLRDPAAYAAMARGVSPYGDGHASERIVEALSAFSRR